MNCPFCNKEMRFHTGPNMDDYSCENKECQFHEMPRYSRTDIDGALAVERIILTDTIYITIEHLKNITTISKLNVVVISDHIEISRALKLDFSNIDKVLTKIKTLIILS